MKKSKGKGKNFQRRTSRMKSDFKDRQKIWKALATHIETHLEGVGRCCWSHATKSDIDLNDETLTSKQLAESDIKNGIQSFFFCFPGMPFSWIISEFIQLHPRKCILQKVFTLCTDCAHIRVSYKLKTLGTSNQRAKIQYGGTRKTTWGFYESGKGIIIESLK